MSKIISNDNSNASDVFLDALRRNPSGAADVEAMARLRQLGLIEPGACACLPINWRRLDG